MAANGSSAGHTIHVLLTWLDLDAYSIRGAEPMRLAAPSGSGPAERFRRICSHFRVYPHFHDSLTEATADRGRA